MLKGLCKPLEFQILVHYLRNKPLTITHKKTVIKYCLKKN